MVDVNNLGEVKLPICTTPIVRENFLAMEYSVFQAYERDLTPVLCNYYINIVSAQDKRVQFSHLHEDKWLVKEKIMHQHHMTWHREMFEDNQDELINIIQKLIANGYYLIGNYNSFYIKAKPAYQCYETNTVFMTVGRGKGDILMSLLPVHLVAVHLHFKDEVFLTASAAGNGICFVS